MELKKSGELRRTAWEKLSGCWGECVSILLVEAGITAVLILSVLLVIKFCYTYGMIDFDIDNFWKDGTVTFYIAATVLTAAALLFLSPLRYGVSWFCLQTAKGRSVPSSSFFSCYTNNTIFVRTLKLQLAVAARHFMLILPAAVLGVGEVMLARNALEDTKDGFVYTVVLCCMILIMAMMLFVYLFVSLRYSLVTYIFAENPEKSVDEIIRESKQCVCGKESYILEVLLSTGPWIASGLLIFPLIFALPYIKMTFTLAAKELMDYNSDDMSAEAGRRIMPHKEESTFV